MACRSAVSVRVGAGRRAGRGRTSSEVVAEVVEPTRVVRQRGTAWDSERSYSGLTLPGGEQRQQVSDRPGDANPDVRDALRVTTVYGRGMTD